MTVEVDDESGRTGELVLLRSDRAPNDVKIQLTIPRQEESLVVAVTLEELIRGLRSVMPEYQVLVAPVAPMGPKDAKRSGERPVARARALKDQGDGELLLS